MNEMRWRFIGALIMFSLYASGCDQPQMSPSYRAPSPSPTPTPSQPLPAVEFREITIGQTVNGVVPPAVPECVGLPGWPCLYFRLVPPSDGRLTVELRYKPDTQPPGRGGLQGLDVSVTSASGGEVWADVFNPDGVTSASLNVTADVIFQITLWYTFPGLQYELQTTLDR